MLTLEEAKAYLRVDSAYEDSLITSLLVNRTLCQVHFKKTHDPIIRHFIDPYPAI